MGNRGLVTSTPSRQSVRGAECYSTTLKTLRRALERKQNSAHARSKPIGVVNKHLPSNVDSRSSKIKHSPSNVLTTHAMILRSTTKCSPFQKKDDESLHDVSVLGETSLSIGGKKGKARKELDSKPSKETNLPSFEPIELANYHNKKDDNLKSPLHSTSNRLGLLLSPVELALFYPEDEEEGFSPAAPIRSGGYYFTAASSKSSKRPNAHYPSRMTCPELGQQNPRSGNQFPCTASRRRQKGPLSYCYTASLDKKICDLETKESVPFLEFSIISLESKMNQALADLQARDRTIETLTEQLQVQKILTSGHSLATNKLVTTEKQVATSTRSLNITGHAGASEDKENIVQGNSVKKHRHRQMTNQFSENTPLPTELRPLRDKHSDITTIRKHPKKIVEPLAQKHVATQVTKEEESLHAYMNNNQSRQVTVLQEQLQVLRRDHHLLREEARIRMSSLSYFLASSTDNSSSSCNVDPTSLGALKTLILPFVRDQVRSSAEAVIVNLASKNVDSSADAVAILKQKLQEAQEETEAVRMKSAEEKVIFTIAIQKLLWNLKQTERKRERAMLRRQIKQLRYGKKIEIEKKKKAATEICPMNDTESWQRFSRRFRLALEGKWPQHDRGNTLGDEGGTLLNPCGLSKAKTLLLELSFERDGSPLTPIYGRAKNRRIKQKCALESDQEEVFKDAMQQIH